MEWEKNYLYESERINKYSKKRLVFFITILMIFIVLSVTLVFLQSNNKTLYSNNYTSDNVGEKIQVKTVNTVKLLFSSYCYEYHMFQVNVTIYQADTKQNLVFKSYCSIYYDGEDTTDVH
ncbi:MAG: hypothetical protein ACFFD1_16490, partial [Candidatus Thorarchaeota archaeon]